MKVIKTDKKRKIKLDKYNMTSAGFLNVDARVTRAGVFDYYDNQGNLVRELRPESEVFDIESIESLKLVPVTFYHPSEMLDASNNRKYDIGTVGETVEKDGEYIKAKIQIREQSIIDYIMDKKKKGESVELSCGYTADVIDEIGYHEKDGEYTKKQINIRYNHLSIVDEGRAGKEVKLIMDSKNHIGNINNNGVDKMAEKTDALQVLLDKTSQELEAEKKKLDSVNAELKEKSEKLDSVQAKLDESAKKVDELEKEIEELKNVDGDYIKNIITEHKAISDAAELFEIDSEGKTFKDVKVEIIKKVHPDFDENEKTDAYIEARFDAVMDFSKKEKDNTVIKFKKILKDSKEEEKVDPREEFKKKTAEKWKNK